MEDEIENSRASGAIAPVISGVETDLARIRSKWERSQKDLAREKQSRRAESDQTAAKIAELHRKLLITSEALEKASSRKKLPGSKSIVIGSAALTVCLLLGAGVWLTMYRPKPEPLVPRTRVYSRLQGSPPKQGPFTGSVSRLSQALASAGGAPEEVFRELNAKASKNGPVCPIEWNDGEPALVFGSGAVQTLSMNVALTRCAEAVERLH